MKKISNIRIASDSAQVNGHTTVTVDGVRMKGITKIELVAERNDLWRAVIHCIPEQIDVTDIDSLAIETAQLRPPEPSPIGQPRNMDGSEFRA